MLSLADVAEAFPGERVKARAADGDAQVRANAVIAVSRTAEQAAKGYREQAAGDGFEQLLELSGDAAAVRAEFDWLDGYTAGNDPRLGTWVSWSALTAGQNAATERVTEAAGGPVDFVTHVTQPPAWLGVPSSRDVVRGLRQLAGEVASADSVSAASTSAGTVYTVVSSVASESTTLTLTVPQGTETISGYTYTMNSTYSDGSTFEVASVEGKVLSLGPATQATVVIPASARTAPFERFTDAAGPVTARAVAEAAAAELNVQGRVTPAVLRKKASEAISAALFGATSEVFCPNAWNIQVAPVKGAVTIVVACNEQRPSVSGSAAIGVRGNKAVVVPVPADPARDARAAVSAAFLATAEAAKGGLVESSSLVADNESDNLDESVRMRLELEAGGDAAVTGTYESGLSGATKVHAGHDEVNGFWMSWDTAGIQTSPEPWYGAMDPVIVEEAGGRVDFLTDIESLWGKGYRVGTVEWPLDLQSMVDFYTSLGQQFQQVMPAKLVRESAGARVYSLHDKQAKVRWRVTVDASTGLVSTYEWVTRRLYYESRETVKASIEQVGSAVSVSRPIPVGASTRPFAVFAEVASVHVRDDIAEEVVEAMKSLYPEGVTDRVLVEQGLDLATSAAFEAYVRVTTFCRDMEPPSVAKVDGNALVLSVSCAPSTAVAEARLVVRDGKVVVSAA